MTKKQVENAKKFLLKVVNSNNRSQEERLRAEYYLSVINKNSLDLYVIDIIGIFVPNTRKYIWNTIINNKKSYDYVEVKTLDNSPNKNRISIVTIKLNEDIREKAILKAKEYLKENNIKLNDIYFNCF